MNKLLALAFLILLLSSCGSDLSEVPEAPVVVKGYLFGGEPVTNIYLENVLTSREFEQQQNIPIENASVKLVSEGVTIPLYSDPERDGFYQNEEYIIQPNTSYDLIVEYEGETITSSCHVPDTLVVINFTKINSVDDITHVGGSENPEVIMSISWESQDDYEYLLALTVDEDELIPLTFNDSEGRFDDFYSLPIKENSADLFDVDFSYLGKNIITIYTISPEYSKYLNYIPTNFDRNLYRGPNNIINGYGVFAGLTGTTFEITLAE